ncbi:MAG: Maf family protein [Crenarchaeota archaeon]|nr:Maf family protein [Thermoproteota archaeon]MCR8453938.1 Maf family protein [Thermoproteota archaeon]MCR8455236.1 Maf family protein [Thermoproteota archaeon]MCR8463006.1 Maf family protein [Thermoproteota archaeon]MCR8470658.1 Maf family protein [Thermoproteota archaeon]
MEIILASSSPRRITLLQKLGLNFRVFPPTYEVEVKSNDPVELAELKALEKARCVARLFDRGLVIAADTVVFVDNEVLEKPKNVDEIKEFLRKLSGREHFVVTGIAIIDASSMKEVVSSELTKVRFRELSDEEIELYARTIEPLDKAGGYAIQGLAALFIDRIEGDFWNVVGLPLALLYRLLKEHFGYNILTELRTMCSLI